MKTVCIQENNGQYYILIALVITALICVFGWGISGNDFWWHVKAGEWMVTNKALPTVDVFSWYAKEKGIVWSSHEWLSQVFLYLIHYLGGNVGIFLLSLSSAITMALLIIFRNRDVIKNNIGLTTLFFVPMIMQIKIMFFGRPHLISFFLIYATLHCLYKLKDNENSIQIYFVPLLAMFWANLHGGSSTLSYILCFVFFFSGLLSFSFGKLYGEKFSRKQLCKYAAAGVLSILALVINPYGVDMLIYPYANMGDGFMQTIIREWSSPDAKVMAQLLFFYSPIFMVVTTLIVTDKRIRLIDLLLFAFFAYMFLRSLRFVFIFYMSSTFYVFNYFIRSHGKLQAKRSISKVVCPIVLLILLSVGAWGVSNIIRTAKDDKLISVALSSKFIKFIKNDAPIRLFNEYDFGETLIYNGIETFVDARADLFSPHNLRDYRSLAFLKHVDNDKKGRVFEPEVFINKYAFGAFIIRPNFPLATYLCSKPEKYKILLQDEEAVYFRHIDP